MLHPPTKNIIIKSALAAVMTLGITLAVAAADWHAPAEANYDWDCVSEWQAASAAGAAGGTLAAACFGAQVNAPAIPPAGVTLAQTCFNAGLKDWQTANARTGAAFSTDWDCVSMWAMEHGAR